MFIVFWLNQYFTFCSQFYLDFLLIVLISRRNVELSLKVVQLWKLLRSCRIISMHFCFQRTDHTFYQVQTHFFRLDFLKCITPNQVTYQKLTTFKNLNSNLKYWNPSKNEFHKSLMLLSKWETIKIVCIIDTIEIAESNEISFFVNIFKIDCT